MAIYKTAYETTLGQAFKTDKILHALKQYIIAHSLENGDFAGLNIISSVNFLPVELYIRPSTSLSEDVPNFAHPFAIPHFKDQSYLCLDSRLFKKTVSDQSGEHINITNRSEYDFSLRRYFLNYAWLNLPPNQIKTSLKFGGVVFANWLAEILARRFSLDPADQLALSVISHFYYQMLFMEKVELTEATKQLLVTQAAQTLGVPANFAFKYVDQIQPMANVKDLVDNIKAILDNIRLHDFSSGFLFNLVGMSWYGLNAKENIVIALEHIPTWLAICYTALSNRTFKHSTIANIALKYSKKGAGDEFIKNYQALIKSFTEEAKSSGNYHWSALEEELLALEQIQL